MGESTIGTTAMPTVTAIESQVRNPERVSVYLDGDFAFGATLASAASHALRVGTVLSSEQVAALRHDDEVDRALSATLNFLSFRPRSRREIETYLRRRKLDDTAASEVLARLDRIGLLDDREFARFWVENRLTFRPRGTRALRAELAQKGIDREISDEAVAAIEDEEPIALDVARKKAKSYAALDDREFVRRMLGHLQRRGFAYGVAARVTRQLQDEREAEVPEDLPPEE
jgi:regulatory protein